MTTPDAPWDAGLQPERTALAWRRFAISFAVVGVATLKALGHRGNGWLPILAGAAVMAIAIVIGVRGADRYGASRRALHHERPLPDGLIVAVSSVSVVVLGLFAAVSILTSA